MSKQALQDLDQITRVPHLLIEIRSLGFVPWLSKTEIERLQTKRVFFWQSLHHAAMFMALSQTPAMFFGSSGSAPRKKRPESST